MLIRREVTAISVTNQKKIQQYSCCESIANYGSYTIFMSEENLSNDIIDKYIKIIHDIGFTKSISFGENNIKESTIEINNLILYGNVKINDKGIIDFLAEENLISKSSYNNKHFKSNLRSYDWNRVIKDKIKNSKITYTNKRNQECTIESEKVKNIIINYNPLISPETTCFRYKTFHHAEEVFNKSIEVVNLSSRNKEKMLILQLLRKIDIPDPQHIRFIETAVKIKDEMPKLHPFHILTLAAFTIEKSYPYSENVFKYKKQFFIDPEEIYNNFKCGTSINNSFILSKKLTKRRINNLNSNYITETPDKYYFAVKENLLIGKIKEAYELFKKCHLKFEYKLMYMGDSESFMTKGEYYSISDEDNGENVLVINDINKRVLISKKLFKWT